MTKNKIQYEIEYEDAPCGFVTFYNYKEPLMKFTEGFGYMGALIFDGESDKIQCHMCGQWFEALAGHIAREHGMNTFQYKEIVGLRQTTALISEKTRAKLIAIGIEKRKKNLRPQRGPMSQTTKDKIRKTLIEGGSKSESKNDRRTCPAQLLDRMIEIANKKGENLRMRDFDGFDETIRKTYGSIKEACRLAGITYHPPCIAHQTMLKTKQKDKITQKEKRKEAILFIQEFVTRFNRKPLKTDYLKQKQLKQYNWLELKKPIVRKEIIKEAFLNLKEYNNAGSDIYYSKQDLIEFLKRFKVINGREASYSDCKRRLLPSLQRYIYRFGSWQKALKAARV